MITVEAEPKSVTLDTGTAIRLPVGMLGLPETTDFELVSTLESFPIMYLRSTRGQKLSFPVVEPGPLVPNYQLELHDADAAFLGDVSGDNAPLVLAVLTVKSLAPQKATINLVGPIVINRQTLIGRQVLLANSDRYSVEHPVIDETQPMEVGKC